MPSQQEHWSAKPPGAESQETPDNRHQGFIQQQGHTVLPPPPSLGHPSGQSSNQPYYSSSLPALPGMPVGANGTSSSNQPSQQPFFHSHGAPPPAGVSNQPQESPIINQPIPSHFAHPMSPQAQQVTPSQAQQQAQSNYRPLNVNDALTYLDQVKSQFQNEPDVYNQFLDIMKDFKSQNIDTPGVISRVSFLFRGHNNLIQGFNTFLPPGYRIECSMDPSDPNPIRVTTPRGSTSRPEPPAVFDGQWRAYAQDARQIESQKSPIQQPQQLGPDRYPNPQYGMGVRPSSSDPTGSVHVVGPDGASLSTGGSIDQLPDGSASQAELQANVDNRRPGDPVEFNYAISYVNKIKTRFSHQPEIYNSFLEILQTYHRDQLRINEVYVQVTQLFNNAPDLLDDFKQFLPDMSQQQQQQQQSGIPSQKMPAHQSQAGQNAAHGHQQMINPADNVRLPPVGNFSPPTVGGSTGAPAPSNAIGANGQSLMNIGSHPPAAHPTTSSRGKKRGNAAAEALIYQSQKHPQTSAGYDVNGSTISNARGTANSRKPRIIDDAPPSPNLVPAIPEALDNHGDVDNTELMEEISFFDKAKRFIANKQTYNEFLKVLNLFSQRIIDKDLLVERVEGFLGGNRELMNWFKEFVRYEGKPLHIENIPYKKHLLELSLCRSYGHSYRLLPKSEPYMPCSGRDEMCWEVLNDEWVGHPVWASEEAGFVAHRKNQYEEIMHRVEEERHEYDYYIEANLRSIQTLETLASRIANMTSEEKAVLKLPPNLGHTSTIYEKVLKKIYGEPRYHEVVDALRETPAVAVPIVLRRMKQKDEEWKRAHREWNKVWRDTEQKVFFKSLDHRGLTFKQTDKKYLTTRQLISEITTVKTEQSNKKISPLQPKPKEQLVYTVQDYDVLMDLVRIVMCFLGHAGSYSSNDRERMELFFKTFLKIFFSVPDGMIQFPSDSEQKPEEEIKTDEDASANLSNGTTETKPSTGSDESAVVDSSVDSTNSKKRAHEPVVEMLRDILKKSKQAKRFRDDPNNGEEEDLEEEEEDPIERTGNLWMKHQSSSVDLFKESKRSTYNLFANNTVYVFVRLLIILYERLEEVKSYESSVSSEIANSRNVQFAIDLDLYDHRMSDMGLAFEPKNCYGQLLSLIERLIEGDLEHQSYEESIRQAYRNRAYKLYTVDKVAQAIVKHLHNIVSDAKSSDVLVLWENDRTNPLTSTKEQIIYRMRVKSLLGSDENLFRIEWNNETHSVMIQFLSNEDITLKRKRSNEDGWNYYLTSYLMSGPTEGVPTDKVHIPFLKRNLVDELTDADGSEKHNSDVDSDSGHGLNSGAESHGDFIDVIDQGLAARIALPTFKMFFEPGTADYFSRKVGVSSNTSTVAAEKQRENRWNAFLNGPTGIKGLEDAQSAEAQARYDAWKNDKPMSPLPNTTEASAENSNDKLEEGSSENADEKTQQEKENASADTKATDKETGAEETPLEKTNTEVKDNDVEMPDVLTQPAEVEGATADSHENTAGDVSQNAIEVDVKEPSALDKSESTKETAGTDVSVLEKEPTKTDEGSSEQQPNAVPVAEAGDQDETAKKEDEADKTQVSESTDTVVPAVETTTVQTDSVPTDSEVSKESAVSVVENKDTNANFELTTGPAKLSGVDSLPPKPVSAAKLSSSSVADSSLPASLPSPAKKPEPEQVALKDEGSSSEKDSIVKTEEPTNAPSSLSTSALANQADETIKENVAETCESLPVESTPNQPLAGDAAKSSAVPATDNSTESNEPKLPPVEEESAKEAQFPVKVEDPMEQHSAKTLQEQVLASLAEVNNSYLDTKDDNDEEVDDEEVKKVIEMELKRVEAEEKKEEAEKL